MSKEYNRINKFYADVIKSLLICIFITASILFIYLQTAQHEFTNYDDNEYVSENKLVHKGLTPETILKAFSVETAGNWHPLTVISHMLDFHIHGLKAGRHLMTNIILHTLNAIFLFFLMKKMTGYVWRSALVAILFALHPIHVESVAWVSERKDILSMLFWLLTTWSYARYTASGKITHYLQVFIFLLLGLMTKPMLVTIPFVLLLFDVWPINRSKTPHISIPKLIYEKLPLFTLVTLSCIITLTYQKAGNALKTFVSYPLNIRIENAIVSYVDYIVKIFWPFDLSVFYPHPGILSFQQTVASLCIVMIITILSLLNLKKRPWLFSGWFLYIGMLIPVIGLVQVGSQAMADRYTYIPAIGIFIVVVWAGAEFLSRYRQKKTIAAVLVSIILFFLILLSRQQTGFWKNSVTLFKHALDVTEQNYLAHNNIGLALKQEGKTLEAIGHYRRSLKIHPNYVLAHNNLGVALMSTGKTEEALKHFSAAVKVMPEFIEAHINMASAFFDAGAFEKAVNQCRNVLKLSKGNVELFIIFGDALSALGNSGEANIQYQKALQLNPNSPKAHNHFGAFLFKHNQIDKAILHFKMASNFNPDDKKYRANLQAALGLKNKLDAMIKEQSRKLEQHPHHPAVHTKLGNLYKKTGNIEAALSHYRKAIDADPEFIPALNGLALEYASKKKYDNAVLLFNKILTIDANQPETYYNIACLYAKQGRVKDALNWLQKAIEKGYNNWETIKSDKDLDNIKATSEYSRLLNLQCD